MSYRSGYASGYTGGYRGGYPGGGRSAAPTSPVMLGLAAWFKHGTNITQSGGFATLWTDVIAGLEVAAAGAARPAYDASAINGQPGIVFSAAGQVMSGAASPLAAGSDRYIMVVCKPTAGTEIFAVGGLLLTMKIEPPVFGLYLALLGGTTYGYTDFTNTDSIASPPAITDVPTVVECGGVVGELPTFALNGVSYSQAGGNVVSSDTGTDGLLIGSFDPPYDAQVFNGPICEILIYNRIPAVGELRTNRQYFHGVFNTPVGP